MIKIKCSTSLTLLKSVVSTKIYTGVSIMSLNMMNKVMKYNVEKESKVRISMFVETTNSNFLLSSEYSNIVYIQQMESMR